MKEISTSTLTKHAGIKINLEASVNIGKISLNMMPKHAADKSVQRMKWELSHRSGISGFIFYASYERWRTPGKRQMKQNLSHNQRQTLNESLDNNDEHENRKQLK